ncbi:MAG: hypothetical protein ACR2FN_02150 [Chitinophagaceae bacterium]
MKKLVKIVTVVLLSTTLWSCATRAVVTERPAPPVEVRPAPPRANYVWIDGEWVWSGGRYSWRNGYWARPNAGHVWVAGHWAQRGHGWYWVSGHWN